ncbi:hypothetical protein M9Y10_028607 [Tritrichomonas musculus]|uniref:Serine aminopeptidase S33 domain-containing protein n=1 Tax=Tritrichomonas musculus TaxID=1915356 RepID=A0ABR2KJT5_9EUKA
MVEYEEVEWDIKYDGEDFNVPLDSVHLMGQIWKPEGDPKFVYVFVHGLAVFITFKKDFFKIIQDMKGVAFACDHLGHGRSPGAKVSCKIDEIIEETKQVILLAHKRYPDLPILLHGHSMGGLTVLKLAMTNQDFVRQYLCGIIAEAPWISRCPQREPGCCTVCCLRCFDKCCCSNSQFDGGVSHFSSDLAPEWVQKMKESPYMGKTITPRLYVSVRDSIKFVRENQSEFPRDVPLLFLQGMNDDLVEGKESEVWINQLISINDTHKITYKSFPEGPHVMLKTKIRAHVIKEMMNFMQTYIPTLASSNSNENQKEEEKNDNNDEGNEEQ